MSWIGWCIIFAALYGGYILVRAAVDLVNWLLDVFIREPREQERLRKLARERRRNALAGSNPPAQVGVAGPARPASKTEPRELP